VRMLHPDDLTPGRLGAELRQLLGGAPPPRSDFSLAGLDGFVANLRELGATAKDEQSPLLREATARV
jgi:predicted glycosyltransferase